MLYSGVSLGLSVDEFFPAELPDEWTAGEPASVLGEGIVFLLPVPETSVTVEAPHVISLP